MAHYMTFGNSKTPYAYWRTCKSSVINVAHDRLRPEPRRGEKLNIKDVRFNFINRLYVFLSDVLKH